MSEMNKGINADTGIDTKNGTKPVHKNTVVLRAPGTGAKGNGSNTMINMGVGFVETVSMQDPDTGSVGVRTVVHILPAQPLTQGKMFMVFPARGRELSDALIAHTHVSDKRNRHEPPGFVLYHDKTPCGSGWLHQGSRSRFIVVKVNRPIDIEVQAEGFGKRFTLFPRFVRESGSADGANGAAKGMAV